MTVYHDASATVAYWLWRWGIRGRVGSITVATDGSSRYALDIARGQEAELQGSEPLWDYILGVDDVRLEVGQDGLCLCVPPLPAHLPEVSGAPVFGGQQHAA